MELSKVIDGTELTLAIEGSLDTLTAPQLEEELNNSLEGIERVVFDFSNLDYISSAGLRILFVAQRTMSSKGGMVVRHPNEDVLDILDITGSLQILTIEQ